MSKADQQHTIFSNVIEQQQQQREKKRTQNKTTTMFWSKEITLVYMFIVLTHEASCRSLDLLWFDCYILWVLFFLSFSFFCFFVALLYVMNKATWIQFKHEIKMDGYYCNGFYIYLQLTAILQILLFFSSSFILSFAI